MPDLEEFEALLLRWGIEFGNEEQDRRDLADLYAQMKHYFSNSGA